MLLLQISNMFVSVNTELMSLSEYIDLESQVK